MNRQQTRPRRFRRPSRSGCRSPQRDPAVLRTTGLGHRACRRERLRLPAGEGALAFCRRPVLRAVLRAQQMPPRVQSSLGSGVIVDPSGLVVTNNHVIANADQIRIACRMAGVRRAAILLKDESLDLAVLKIGASETFPSIAIGDGRARHRRSRPGDRQSVRRGADDDSGSYPLSLARISASPISASSSRPMRRSIPDSGGALINMAGEVIGINNGDLLPVRRFDRDRFAIRQTWWGCRRSRQGGAGTSSSAPISAQVSIP